MSETNSSESGRRNRRYRNIVLDRRFQVKYAVVMALLGGLIFGVMAWLFFDQVRENSELTALDVAVASANSSAPAVAPAAAPSEFEREMSARLAKEDAAVRWTLAAFWLGLVLALFLVGLVATHRIVGPIHVVDGYLKKILKHEEIQPRRLRRGDEFKDLFRRANEVVAQIQHERDHDSATLKAAIKSIRAGVTEVGGASMGGWLDEALAPLEAMADTKTTHQEEA